MPKSPAELSPELSLLDAFIHVSDPRSERGRVHPLINILAIAVCGVICGADSWVAIATWGKMKEDWLAGFLDLKEGVPSHDTFGRVFAVLSPDAFQDAFFQWARGLAGDLSGKVVAVDGKTVRRSHDRSAGKSAIHVVSAWCTTEGVALGQLKTDEKSNEITAMPELLRLLDLRGAIVTIDAMGCQKKISEAIRDGKADYVLAVKDNQPKLAGAIQRWFDAAVGGELPGAELLCATSSNKGHGRKEERNVWVAPAPSSLPAQEEWADLRSIVWAESIRIVGDKRSSNHRYYISSLPPDDAEQFLRVVREHWGIENGLHWVLDLAFREDESRIRVGHAAQNMTLLRHIALNLLKQEKTAKVGVKIKRLRAGWDSDYLLTVLGLVP